MAVRLPIQIGINSLLGIIHIRHLLLVDIDGISGATISVHSMTRGIHKLSYLIKALKEEL